jgi:L-aminopeptidase/D-esterase-like protein
MNCARWSGPLFAATVDATEEAVLDSLWRAERVGRVCRICIN